MEPWQGLTTAAMPLHRAEVGRSLHTLVCHQPGLATALHIANGDQDMHRIFEAVFMVVLTDDPDLVTTRDIYTAIYDGHWYDFHPEPCRCRSHNCDLCARYTEWEGRVTQGIESIVEHFRYPPVNLYREDISIDRVRLLAPTDIVVDISYFD
jgi:hypothetical protein